MVRWGDIKGKLWGIWGFWGKEFRDFIWDRLIVGFMGILLWRCLVRILLLNAIVEFMSIEKFWSVSYWKDCITTQNCQPGTC